MTSGKQVAAIVSLLLAAANSVGAQGTCSANGNTAYGSSSACPRTIVFHVQGVCLNACGQPGSEFLSPDMTATGSCSPHQCLPRLAEINVWDQASLRFSTRGESNSGEGCSRHDYQSAVGVCTCTSCSGPGGANNNTAPGEDPLLISVDDTEYLLSSFEKGVKFDLNGDGELEKTAWTRPGSDDCFLALDRNFNGRIDDGTEIFGDETPQLPSDDPNGFRALALFDEALNGGNQDGKIDAEDEIYSALLLWNDANQDGKSSSNELRGLADWVTAIHLAYQRGSSLDEHGNELRYWARLDRPAHSTAAVIAWNVFFAKPASTPRR